MLPHSPNNPPSGQHLLCVRYIFYFRCALPAAQKRLESDEIEMGTCSPKSPAACLSAFCLACMLWCPVYQLFPLCDISLSNTCLLCRERMPRNAKASSPKKPLCPALFPKLSNEGYKRRLLLIQLLSIPLRPYCYCMKNFCLETI